MSKKKAWKPGTTQVNSDDPIQSNILNREFQADRPHQKWTMEFWNIQWDSIGNVFYNLWAILVATVFVMVIACPIGYLVSILSLYLKMLYRAESERLGSADILYQITFWSTELDSQVIYSTLPTGLRY